MRILLDPAPEQGGGTTAPTPTTTDNPGSGAPPTNPPAPPPPPPPPAEVKVPVDEFQRLVAQARRMAEYEAEKLRELEAKEREKIKAIAEKGEVEKAMTQLDESWKGKYSAKDQELSSLRQQYYGEKKLNAIHAGLGAAEFLSDEARRDAVDKLDRMLEARVDGAGAVVVVDRQTGRPADAVIKEALGSATLHHYLKPSTQGGGGAPGGNRTTATASPGNAPDQFRASIDAIRARLGQANGDAPGLAGTYGGQSAR